MNVVVVVKNIHRLPGALVDGSWQLISARQIEVVEDITCVGQMEAGIRLMVTSVRGGISATRLSACVGAKAGLAS